MKRFSSLRSWLLLAIFPWLVGCVSLNVQNMVTDKTSVGTKHPATVALSVVGGSPGVKWFSGTIDPKQFETAARQSLEKSELFSSVVAADAAEYLLNVKLTYAGSHPGFTMHAWVNAEGALIERASGKEAWKEMIKGEARATAGEAFSGAKRQFMALERSAKANIEQALAKVAS